MGSGLIKVDSGGAVVAQRESRYYPVLAMLGMNLVQLQRTGLDNGGMRLKSAEREQKRTTGRSKEKVEERTCNMGHQCVGSTWTAARNC